MFKVKNIKTNTIFNYPTIEEALYVIKTYKSLELVDEKKPIEEDKKDLQGIEAYIPKPKPKTKK